MDWERAVEWHHAALKRILAMLVAMAGLAGAEATMTRRRHRAVTRLLRPAEAAARRLIIIAARGLAVKLPKWRERKPKPRPKSIILKAGSKGTGLVLPHDRVAARALLDALGVKRRPPPEKISLPLLDPLTMPRPWKPIQRSVPRIRSLYDDPVAFPVKPHFPVKRPTSPHDPVSAARLKLRLAALAAALDDLPGQARRYAHWSARREALHAEGKAQWRPGRRSRYCRRSPLKPGRAPGARKRPTHEVHEVLRDVHGLARLVLERRDTS